MLTKMSRITGVRVMLLPLLRPLGTLVAALGWREGSLAIPGTQEMGDSGLCTEQAPGSSLSLPLLAPQQTLPRHPFRAQGWEPPLRYLLAGKLCENVQQFHASVSLYRTPQEYDSLLYRVAARINQSKTSKYQAKTGAQ